MGFHFLVARGPVLFCALFCLLSSICVYPAKLLITALVLLLVNYAFGLAGHAAGKLCFWVQTYYMAQIKGFSFSSWKKQNKKFCYVLQICHWVSIPTVQMCCFGCGFFILLTSKWLWDWSAKSKISFMYIYVNFWNHWGASSSFFNSGGSAGFFGTSLTRRKSEIWFQEN